MNIQPGNAQDMGKRDEQQDSFGFSDINDQVFAGHGGVLVVLADGMGGLDMGREASQTAVRVMLEEYRTKTVDEDIIDALDRALDAANDEVYAMADEEGIAGDAGTTLVAAVIHRETLSFVSVGDSRLYLFREGELHLMTRDHSYYTHLIAMVRDGEISAEEAAEHPDRGALTSFVGLPVLREVDICEEPVPLRKGDRVMLCSDGLWGVLHEDEITPHLAGDPQEAAEILVRRVLDKDLERQDNVTVAILAIE